MIDQRLEVDDFRLVTSRPAECNCAADCLRAREARWLVRQLPPPWSLVRPYPASRLSHRLAVKSSADLRALLPSSQLNDRNAFISLIDKCLEARYIWFHEIALRLIVKEEGLRGTAEASDNDL